MYFLHFKGVKVFQNFLMPSFNSSVDFGLISFLRYAFIEPHTFSIGLRSGLEGGVFHQFIPFRA